MILERTVRAEDLVLVSSPKPDKAVLKIGDYVRMNSGGAALAVVGFGPDEIEDGIVYPTIIVRAEGWSRSGFTNTSFGIRCGHLIAEDVVIKRLCVRQVRWLTYLVRFGRFLKSAVWPRRKST